MVDLSHARHHPVLESIVDVLCTKTRKTDRKFFRSITAYHMAVAAASMRANLMTKDRGEIPINCYTMALAPSGFGKGHSTYVLENDIMKAFRETFRDHILPIKAENNMRHLASRRAALNNTEEEEEFIGLEKEFAQTGEYPFVFDGASEPAIKQIRQMLLLAGCGSINYQVDEIGSNLEKSGEALNTYLELYDQGLIKAKLTKNSADNKRTKEIEGKTPANMLLYGTPDKLFDSGPIEKKFYSLLDTGYARRCLFGMGEMNTLEEVDNLTPAEIYQMRIDPSHDATIAKWSHLFERLGDINKFNWLIDVPDAVGIELLTYQIECEAKAKEMHKQDGIRKAEMEHRYYKALKLAGVYAFIDEAMELSMDHLYAAILLVEESGEAFNKMLTREAPYEKLARYLASVGGEQTHTDLLEALPFYKGSQSHRTDLISMAMSWGYKQHIVLKKSFVDGIEFFSGETLKETSLDAVKVAYSQDFALGYSAEEVPFDQLHVLTQQQGFHWTNHAFEGGHRQEDNAIPGFNLVVIDVDGGASLDTVQELMKEYTFMTYTTKRSTPEQNRFRLILPTNYELKLSAEDYREFMDNIASWLPFATDEGTHQRCKKWMSCHTGSFHYNLEGNLLDVLPFVPKTKKNELYQKSVTELTSLDNLERWFAQRFAEGHRNNQMIKFALALVDSGMNYVEVESKVIAFNGKISNGLSDEELRKTVLVTVAKKLQGTP